MCYFMIYYILVFSVVLSLIILAKINPKKEEIE